MGVFGPSWTWEELRKKDDIMNDLKRENDRILDKQRKENDRVLRQMNKNERTYAEPKEVNYADIRARAYQHTAEKNDFFAEYYLYISSNKIIKAIFTTGQDSNSVLLFFMPFAFIGGMIGIFRFFCFFVYWFFLVHNVFNRSIYSIHYSKFIKSYVSFTKSFI